MSSYSLNPFLRVVKPNQFSYCVNYFLFSTMTKMLLTANSIVKNLMLILFSLIPLSIRPFKHFNLQLSAVRDTKLNDHLQ